MKVHTFISTASAKNQCQCNDEIKTGDVLVIVNERVVGVAYTWPIAVTCEYGALYTLKPGSSPEQWASDPEFGNPALLEGAREAVKEARARGYEIFDEFAHL